MAQLGKNHTHARAVATRLRLPEQRTVGKARARPAAAAPAEQLADLRAAEPRARRAMRSAYAGFLLDMYDVYVPVVALAPAIAYFQPADATDRQRTVVFYVTFAVTLLGRPVGATVFGHLADRWGRRRLTVVSVAGFSAVSLLIACLPGYAQVGWLAVGLLVLLRFVNGIFLGGEYTAATPLAFEHCPTRARGLFGGVLIGAFATSYIVASLLVLGLLQVMAHDGASSPYAEWGWRVPFVVGALLGFVFVAYRRKVPESALWQQTRKVHRPVREVLAGSAAAQFRQVFVLMSGLWFTGAGVVSVLPVVLFTQLDVDPTTGTWVMLVAYAGLGAAMLVTGVLGQALGRRTVLLGCAGLALAVACPLYVVLASGRAGGLAGLLFLTSAVVAFAMAGWGVAMPYLAERFPTAVRSSGFGLGYTLAVIIPSLFSMWMWALGHFMPYRYTQIVLLALGGVLLAVGAWTGPETVDADLRGAAREGPHDGPVDPQ